MKESRFLHIGQRDNARLVWRPFHASLAPSLFQDGASYQAVQAQIDPLPAYSKTTHTRGLRCSLNRASVRGVDKCRSRDDVPLERSWSGCNWWELGLLGIVPRHLVVWKGSKITTYNCCYYAVLSRLVPVSTHRALMAANASRLPSASTNASHSALLFFMSRKNNKIVLTAPLLPATSQKRGNKR